jgi:hypothetical protein
MTGIRIPIGVHPFVNAIRQAMPQPVQVSIHLRLRRLHRTESEWIFVRLGFRQGLGLL